MSTTKRSRGLSRFDRVSRAITMHVIVFTMAIQVIGIVMITRAVAGGYLVPLTAATWIAMFAGFIAGLLFLSFHLDDFLANILVGVILYVTGDVAWDIIKRPSSFTLAQGFWGAFMFTGALALVLLLIRALLLLTRQLKRLATAGFSPVVRARAWFRRTGKTAVLAQLALVAIAVPAVAFHAVSTRGLVAVPVEITPGGHQLRFRMWAEYTPAYYTAHPNGTQMLEQLDRHGVTIQNAIFSIRDADGKAESFSPTIHPDDAAACIATLTWFNATWPGITFQYYAYGLGGQSCGNYEGSIYTGAMLKRFVDVYRASNLTNVIGVYTDWEGPLRTAPNNANATLNGWHQAMWVDAMAYARSFFPGWVFSCCHPESVFWDPVDGDPDLQYYQRYNIYMPPWDDYGPMVYPSCNIGRLDPHPNVGSSQVYVSGTGLVAALGGNVDKATMWLGCTGCGPYRNESRPVERGLPLDFGEGKGFDALARDILIAKHLGMKTVSIFLGMESFEPETRKTGFFDQYGYADALDRLNETVNGPASTTPFTIWVDGKHSPARDLMTDALLDFNRFEFIPIALGILTVALFAACKAGCKASKAGRVANT